LYLRSGDDEIWNYDVAPTHNDMLQPLARSNSKSIFLELRPGYHEVISEGSLLATFHVSDKKAGSDSTLGMLGTPSVTDDTDDSLDIQNRAQLKRLGALRDIELWSAERKLKLDAYTPTATTTTVIIFCALLSSSLPLSASSSPSPLSPSSLSP
jgi:hypothetical protein